MDFLSSSDGQIFSSGSQQQLTMSDANLAEQAEELEVLASIYPEEFKSLGHGQFKILLKPNPDGNDNHGKFVQSFSQHPFHILED